MTNAILITAEDTRWDQYIRRLPADKQDIYYLSHYYQAAQAQENGQTRMFVYEDEKGNLAVYPFIMRKIEDPSLDRDYYDIETAYGYGGPLANTEDPFFLEYFENAFLECCGAEHIIAEFIRFHPLMRNERIFQKNIAVLHNRLTVWLDLRQDIEEIWMKDVSTQNRNVIRKCQKSGLCVEISHDYDEFRTIYNDTMKRVGADDFYFFPKEYYEQISGHEEYVLLRVKNGQDTVSAAIFMGCGGYFHYHLSGSVQEALKLSPTAILLWEAIRYAKEHGYQKMHFGGGRTESPDDSLFGFKKKFSSTYTDFYIGKRIHDPAIYDYLIDAWQKKNGRKASRLLQYRE